MTTGAPTLYPNPLLRDGPTLSLVDGWLVVTKPHGKAARYAIGAHESPHGAANGVVTLAHHTTAVRPPTGDAVRATGVRRSSWRLLDRDGRPLVWLANADQGLYDVEQARDFAAAAGLEFRDVGTVSARELTSTRPSSSMNGPGTGRLSSFVAPAKQWGLTLALLGGMLFTAPVAAAFWSDNESTPGSGGTIRGWGGVVVLVSFVAFILFFAWAAGYLSGGVASLRWRRHWRGRPADPRLLLSARRLPGLALSLAPGGGLEIRDLGKTRSLARGDGLALQPYEITPDDARPASGLLVRDPAMVVAHIPARFDPEEVHAFAGSLGARSLPLLDHAEQVPKLRTRKRRQGRGPRLEDFVIGRPSLYVWGVTAWCLTALTPALIAGAVAIAVGWVDLSWVYAAFSAGIGSLVGSVWVLYATQTPVWLRRPGALGPGAR